MHDETVNKDSHPGWMKSGPKESPSELVAMESHFLSQQGPLGNGSREVCFRGMKWNSLQADGFFEREQMKTKNASCSTND